MFLIDKILRFSGVEVTKANRYGAVAVGIFALIVTAIINLDGSSDPVSTPDLHANWISKTYSMNSELVTPPNASQKSTFSGELELQVNPECISIARRVFPQDGVYLVYEVALHDKTANLTEADLLKQKDQIIFHDIPDEVTSVYRQHFPELNQSKNCFAFSMKDYSISHTPVDWE